MASLLGEFLLTVGLRLVLSDAVDILGLIVRAVLLLGKGGEPVVDERKLGNLWLLRLENLLGRVKEPFSYPLGRVCPGQGGPFALEDEVAKLAMVRSGRL